MREPRKMTILNFYKLYNFVQKFTHGDEICMYFSKNVSHN